MESTTAMFSMFVVAFLLYLFLKRNPTLLEKIENRIENVQDDALLLGKPIKSYTQGPAFLMMASPWLFAPPIGQVMQKPTGTSPDGENKQLTIGAP